ncbi:MAG TPA: ABC transporter ATP-binding protein [Actinomycetota bacterium]
MAVVEFDRVSKRFGHVDALEEVSFEIGDGEFVVLVGPSGSGKTTALRILAGLELPTSGEIRVDGRVVNDLSPRDRDVAMVFQDYALYPQMTVRQNLGFSLRVRKLAREEIERRVRATAEMLELGPLLDRRPRELSGGQRQRVALGRALVREPKVFLMDEPLSNLDAQLRTQTRGEIRRLQQAVGVTTAYVTHDQVEAMTMGDRIVVMNRGVVEQVGEPSSVYDRPANVFVAGFIGSPAMVLARFSASNGDGVVRLTRGGASMEVPSAGTPLPAEVVVGVRPEHAELWSDREGIVGPIEGRVRFVEDLGREQFVGVAVAEDTTFTLQVEGRAAVELDAVVRFGFRRGRIHVFDPETGQALGRL